MPAESMLLPPEKGRGRGVVDPCRSARIWGASEGGGEGRGRRKRRGRDAVGGAGAAHRSRVVVDVAVGEVDRAAAPDDHPSAPALQAQRREGWRGGWGASPPHLPPEYSGRRGWGVHASSRVHVSGEGDGVSGGMGRGGEAQYEHATSRWHCAHADVVKGRGKWCSYCSWIML